MSTSTSNPTLPQGDIQGLLEKIKQLEANNQQLAAEREQVAQQNQQLSARLGETESKMSALTQKTQEEMMNKINTTIATWLESQGLAPEKKEQVKAGLHELARATAQESGLYQLMCCASENHLSNVTQLEDLRRERDELRERLEGGNFAREEDRVQGKRKADVISADEAGQKAGGGMWDDFKIMLEGERGWCRPPAPA